MRVCGWADGQTDKMKFIFGFRNCFTNVPKKLKEQLTKFWNAFYYSAAWTALQNNRLTCGIVATLIVIIDGVKESCSTG